MGLSICLVVWLLSISTLLDRPSNGLYDLLCRYLPEKERIEDPILLVETAYEDQFEKDRFWFEVIDTLASKGVRQIVFTFLPEQATPAFYHHAVATSNIILATKRGSAGQESTLQMQPQIVETIPGITHLIGTITVPEELHGISRSYRSVIVENRQTHPSLVIVAAQQLGKKIHELPEQFRINFIGQPDHLPTVHIDDLMAGRLIDQMLENKIVLIGQAPPFPFKGYNTPHSDDRLGVTPLEYQGLALQTVATNSVLRFPGKWELLGCLLLVVFLNLTAHQYFGTFTHIVLSIVFLGSLVVLHGVLLYFSQLWVPIIEILLAFLLFQSLLGIRDNMLRNRLALQIILDQSFKRREQVMPKSFFRSPDYWSLVVNMVNQTLNLKRFIFLEAVEGDHRVKEVIALNCSLEDIKERRRDYHRTPYKTALEQNGSIEVSRYFSELPHNEQSYLVPLNFAGQVQGFWAFTVDRSEEKQEEILLSAVNNFAVEIGEMLFRRKQWVTQSRWYEHPLRKILNMEKQNEPYREVSRILAFLVRRLSILESVFNALDTATILYNPFGVVIQSNTKMIGLLKSHGLNAYELSALDLAVRITGSTAEQIRRLLGKVIINYESIQLPITVGEDKSQTLMLRIRPLVAANEDDDELRLQPIELNGILFEISDVSSLIEINRVRESLFHYSLLHIKEEIETISYDFNELNEVHCGNEGADYQPLLDRSHKLGGFIDSLDGYLGQDNELDTATPYPVSIKEIIERCVTSMKAAAERQKIGVSISIAETLPLALIVPNRFMELFESLLQVLITDGYEGSIIEVEVNNEDDSLVCRMRNEGVGMPNETLQRFLDPSEHVDRHDFQLINQISPELEYWQANLSGSSSFGSGIRFELTLSSFQT